MRFEDGLCALEVSKEGILIGEGITLLNIGDKIKQDTVGDKVMKSSLQVPFEKIMENAIGDYKDIKEDIVTSNYQKIYNFYSNKLENIDSTEIIDPMNVTIEALKNAISIASMLLTTNYLVISENIKNDKVVL